MREISADERASVIACETTGEHHFDARVEIERVTFLACGCGAIAILVDGEPITSAADLDERLGAAGAARIGALLAQRAEGLA